MEIRDKRSEKPRNSTAMTEGGGASAVGPRILQPPVAKKFDASTHGATHPPLAHASGGHGHLLAPIGDVGGQIIMKGGCRCLVCVDKEISLARQPKASASTTPTLPPSRPNTPILPLPVASVPAETSTSLIAGSQALTLD